LHPDKPEEWGYIFWDYLKTTFWIARSSRAMTCTVGGRQ
jgi:hypothetical protein